MKRAGMMNVVEFAEFKRVLMQDLLRLHAEVLDLPQSSEAPTYPDIHSLARLVPRVVSYGTEGDGIHFSEWELWPPPEGELGSPLTDWFDAWDAWAIPLKDLVQTWAGVVETHDLELQAEDISDDAFTAFRRGSKRTFEPREDYRPGRFDAEKWNEDCGRIGFDWGDDDIARIMDALFEWFAFTPVSPLVQTPFQAVSDYGESVEILTFVPQNPNPQGQPGEFDAEAARLWEIVRVRMEKLRDGVRGNDADELWRNWKPFAHGSQTRGRGL